MIASMATIKIELFILRTILIKIKLIEAKEIYADIVEIIKYIIVYGVADKI